MDNVDRRTISIAQHLMLGRAYLHANRNHDILNYDLTGRRDPLARTRTSLVLRELIEFTEYGDEHNGLRLTQRGIDTVRARKLFV